jgi:DNA-binding LytR/AlgR family response regulator
MKVLVVDDEAPARRRLIRMLEEIPGVDVVGEAAGGLQALASLSRTQPDLMLLDICMPELDGLALASRYTHLPSIVFVTAHDEHAVRAFECNAVDYLLKPVRPERLAEAIRRARARGAPASESLRALPPTEARQSAAPRVITHDGGTLRLFDACSVTRFWASDKYTLFVAEGREQMTEEPLSSLEERLAAHGFVRVHRAELVRSSAIRALRSEHGVCEVCLDDGQVARVSRRSIALLKRELGL